MTTKEIEITLPTGTLRLQTNPRVTLQERCDIACDIRWYGEASVPKGIQKDIWVCEEHARHYNLIW
jgi:hypothetical protein